MKGLPTFSMDGPVIIKTWASCYGEREDSSWFLPDLASLTFPAFLKPLVYSRFWKTEEKLDIDVYYFCFAGAHIVTTRLYPKCMLLSLPLRPPNK